MKSMCFTTERSVTDSFMLLKLNRPQPGLHLEGKLLLSFLTEKQDARMINKRFTLWLCPLHIMPQAARWQIPHLEWVSPLSAADSNYMHNCSPTGAWCSQQGM